MNRKDRNSKEFKEFQKNYKGLLPPSVAYEQAKRQEQLEELEEDGIYLDSNGILNQRW